MSVVHMNLLHNVLKRPLMPGIVISLVAGKLCIFLHLTAMPVCVDFVRFM